jgi:hypothetical protein
VLSVEKKAKHIGLAASLGLTGNRRHLVEFALTALLLAAFQIRSAWKETPHDGSLVVSFAQHDKVLVLES